MASLQLHLLKLVLLLPLVTSFVPIIRSSDGDKLLNRMNDFRTSLNIPTLDKHDRADCLADEIADQLENQPCKPISPTDPETQFSNYPKQLSECKLDLNTTRDGALMVACVPHGVEVALFNFTQSQFVQYLNNSKYTGAGVGTEDDWVVVVLTTNTPAGSFAKSDAGAHFVPNKVFVGLSGIVVAMFLGGFVGLFH
ncbi:hypothetical protein Scep_030427 [Stephania cephalantha]|uniref:Uncharacterized GPI-anchored protein At5g19230-like domain-containing protein n=1 Tax=Stephania cephalantha TaxID=152367 RepID=A0AAP0HGW1_9MAGN